jgi:hypothetical protein
VFPCSDGADAATLATAAFRYTGIWEFAARAVSRFRLAGRTANKACRVPGRWAGEPFRRSVPGWVFAFPPACQHPLFASGPKAKRQKGRGRAEARYI